MNARSVWFTEPYTVTVEPTTIPVPDAGEVLVETIVSAVSAGTEGVIYRGEAPPRSRTDPIETIPDNLEFPVQYGYAAVGRVTALGDGVHKRWHDRTVYVYGPHASHFVLEPQALIPVPAGIKPREAAFLANTETAVNFLLDGRPLIGERIVVFGLGVVGSLTSALLAQTPVHALIGVDYHEMRRRTAEQLGVETTFHPDTDDLTDLIEDTTGGPIDLAYELTGNPDALEHAVETVGFHGRVVVGSWYGTKPTNLTLGDHFHRDRVTIKSSQVSSIAALHTGRWSRNRRRSTAWTWIDHLDVESLITHEVAVDAAPDMYQLLDEQPGQTIQILFTYD